MKTGLDFFPRDTDFYNDDRIMALMERFGPLGVTIFDLLLTLIYKNGYYLSTPKDRLALQVTRLIGSRWIPKKDLVWQVIRYCAEIGLFHEGLLEQNVLTSARIQQRYDKVTVRSKANKEKYWLLNEEPVENS